MSRVNLFVIGVNKAGTSWLYQMLNQHPDVFMADAKELYFFGDVNPEDEGIDDLETYHRHFPFEESYRYFGDATVMYYQRPEIADEIQAYNPDAKLLAIVRDPIERLLSQYQYHKQLGLLGENTTLSEALDGRAPQLIRDSHYEQTLPAYTDRFGPEQFRVVSLEAGRDDPEAFWATLLDYLDLPESPYDAENTRPENPTGSAAFRMVYRSTVQVLRRYSPRTYRRLLESSVARWAKLGLLRLLGTAGGKRTALTDEVAEQLREEFAPTYEYLQSLGFDYAPPDPAEASVTQ